MTLFSTHPMSDQAKAAEPNFEGSASICIQGNVYMRHGEDIFFLSRHSGCVGVCGIHHVAPNGVAIKQLAYALALIEGAIQIHDPTPICGKN